MYANFKTQKGKKLKQKRKQYIKDPGWFWNLASSDHVGYTLGIGSSSRIWKNWSFTLQSDLSGTSMDLLKKMWSNSASKRQLKKFSGKLVFFRNCQHKATVTQPSAWHKLPLFSQPRCLTQKKKLFSLKGKEILKKKLMGDLENKDVLKTCLWSSFFI